MPRYAVHAWTQPRWGYGWAPTNSRKKNDPNRRYFVCDTRTGDYIREFLTMEQARQFIEKKQQEAS